MKRWAAFLDLCLLLAPTPRIPDTPWEEIDWPAFIEFSSRHLASPAVWPVLQNVPGIPSGVKEYFQAVHGMNAVRNAGIVADIERITVALSEASIRAVLLKGAATVAGGLYRDPAERVMADVDVLVPARETARARACLSELGYADVGDPRPPRWFSGVHHLPGVATPGGTFLVEIHHRLGDREVMAILPARSVIERAVPVAFANREVLTPRPTDLIVYNIVHSQLHHELHSRGLVEVRQLRELALLSVRAGGGVDWAEVEWRFKRIGRQAVLATTAVLVRELMGVTLPVPADDSGEPMRRLREAVLQSGSGPPENAGTWRSLQQAYVQRFFRQPELAVNLLNPFWWPQRLRNIAALVRDSRRNRREP